MAYSINPNLVKARKEVLLAVLVNNMPVCIAARRYGVHRCTVWRWMARWRELNQHVSQDCPGRPNRKTSFCPSYYRWRIETLSSAPKSHPHRIPEWVRQRILELRSILGRCAVIIHKRLTDEGIRVSVSTVERIIARFCTLKTRRRHIRRTLPRPEVKAPGDLVEMDTVHYVDKLTGERRYIFTVIDLYSRVSYARCYDRILPGGAFATLMAAEQYFGFRIKVVQTDNGSEFSSWFAERASGRNIIHRHTRIRRPNDNAHIERFNRTLREECIGSHMSCHSTTVGINRKLRKYLDYYNDERLHLGIQCRTPRVMLRR